MSNKEKIPLNACLCKLNEFYIVYRGYEFGRAAVLAGTYRPEVGKHFYHFYFFEHRYLSFYTVNADLTKLTISRRLEYVFLVLLPQYGVWKCIFRLYIFSTRDFVLETRYTRKCVHGTNCYVHSRPIHSFCSALWSMGANPNLVTK